MAERKSFLLRIDQRLYDDVKRWADAEFRSVNAQIEFILRRSVDERMRRPQPEDNPPEE